MLCAIVYQSGSEAIKRPVHVRLESVYLYLIVASGGPRLSHALMSMLKAACKNAYTLELVLVVITYYLQAC